MSHPEKDELIFVYDCKFSAGACGSPAGEIKQFIHTPSIKLVDLDCYDIEDWDFIYVDKNFNMDEYLYVQKRYEKIIKGMPFVLPDDETLKNFHEKCSSMFEVIRNNQQENQTLANLRDTLLPKLMSGELDVDSVQL